MAEVLTPAFLAAMAGLAAAIWIASRRARQSLARRDAELLLAEMRHDMDLEEFQSAANVSDVPDPGSKLVEVGDRLIALIHAAGHWYALDDVCTHDGGPLSEGPVDAAGRTIACPRHGAKFDLATGAALTMPATKPTVAHEVRIDGNRVLVRLAN